MKIDLPVSWAMSGVVRIEADSIEDAIKKFTDREDVFYDLYDLDIEVIDKQYIEGSFELTYETDLIQEMNPSKPMKV